MTPSAGARTPTGAEPARSRSKRRLLFVSVGLSPHGGGIATAGRLLLGAVRAWAEETGVELRLFTLGCASDLPAGVAGRAFDGDRAALGRAVWKAQFLEGFRHQVYDFLGVARIQGVLPQRWLARYLLYVYGIEVWRPLTGGRRRALTGATVRLACSQHTIDRLRAHNPQAPPVIPLHLAVSEGNCHPAADPALLARVGEGFLLIVGRMEGDRYKGHEELIQAMTQLAPAHPHVRLVIVGEGRDQPRLEARARELGIAERVVFTGFLDEPTLAAVYRRCAVFTMPSEGEGFGLVYLEAMRAGKPCVALAGSAAAEIVVDGSTGRLVAPGVEPLTRTLDEMLGDSRGTAALGAAGRDRWHERFLPERFAAGLRPHLETLMSEEPA